MKVLYFGTYDPEYSRNRVLIKGLRLNGVEVAECNDRSRHILKYIRLFFKHLKFRGKYDVMIVGFPGQEAMFLARLISQKKIIFDTFTSHYGGHILDRAKYSENSFMARSYKWIDRRAVILSNISLLDTDAHIDFFVTELGLPRNKFRRIFVGTDSSVFYPRDTVRNDGKFLVHFHGHFIPLQGVQYIIEAAKILEGESIIFNIIGRGQDYMTSRDLAKRLNLNNVNFIDSVSYDKLVEYISMADISLGIFGKTPKTEIVIPNKVYEAIACAKPVITANTEAIRELFQDGKNILLCERANPEDLAQKIMSLRNDAEMRARIGRAGYQLFQERATEKIIGQELLGILNSI